MVFLVYLSNSRPPPSNATPHLIHIRPLHLVIPRLRSRLIDDVRRRLAQSRPLALEAQVTDPRHVLVAVAKVVHEEQHQPLDAAKRRALDGDLLDFRRLRELQDLHRRGIVGGGKVDVVAVDVEVQRFGR